MAKVAILYGYVPKDAPEDEKDLLIEVEAVRDALKSLGNIVFPVSLKINPLPAIKRLQKIQPDYVFNLVESIEGEIRLAGHSTNVINYLKLPYTGNPAEAIGILNDKTYTKRILHAMNLPTPGFCDLEQALLGNFPQLPVIIKSQTEHASVGLDEDSVADTSEELMQKLEQRKELKGGVFIESYIDGREFNISVIADEGKPRVLPHAEIKFLNYPVGKPKVVGYKAKWNQDTFEYKNTQRTFEFPPSDEPLLTHLSKITEECWNAFSLHGYARVDFRVDKKNNPYVLEINTNPCISPDAGLAAAADQAGIGYASLIEKISQDLNR